MFQVLLILTLIVISYLIFSRPSYSQSIPHVDKIGHFGSFFVLAWLTHQAFKPKLSHLTVGLTLYAGLIEIVQSYLPYRSASWGDVLADLLGIAFFYLTLFCYREINTQMKNARK